MPEWISVKDRLPQSGHSYLTWIDGEMQVNYFSRADQTTNGPAWFVYDPYDEYGAFPKRVTHWMPLPDPPKASE